jgi:predicted RNase H-like nuclease
VIEALEDEVDSVSFYEVEKTLKNVLQRWSDVSQVVPIADKWKGGKLIMEPGTATQNKEVPIDVFFHKMTMVRDRLRVMEQKVNSSNLDESEKIDLQQYITRIYGSLTTFNVLFKSTTDYFVGDKSK